MAYSGATAASSVANPPRCIAGGAFARLPGATTGLSTAPTKGPNLQGGALWFYASTNKTTDRDVSNFFSDGFYLGMAPGDMVFGVEFTSAGSSVQTFMNTITGVSTSGATMSTGGSLTSTHA